MEHDWCVFQVNHATRQRWLTYTQPDRMFAVWRDPVDRFRSAWAYLLGRECFHLSKEDMVEYQSIVENSLQYLLDRLQGGDYSIFPELFQQNVWGLWEDDVDVLRFSHLDQDFNNYTQSHGLPYTSLPREKVNLYPKPELTSKQVAQVQMIYQEDYKPLDFWKPC